MKRLLLRVVEELFFFFFARVFFGVSKIFDPSGVDPVGSVTFVDFFGDCGISGGKVNPTAESLFLFFLNASTVFVSGIIVQKGSLFSGVVVVQPQIVFTN